MPGGSNQGYSGLFHSNNSMEQAKDNLNVLQSLKTTIDNDRAKQEDAQARIAQMQEQIRKETDMLLTPDKIAIRNRARAQFRSIATQLQASGGKYTNFLASGGRALIEDYKSSILSSEDMANYQDNSKNMATILELEKTGKSHLINAVDRANLDKYRTNGGGKITYTGQMQEIDIPPSNEYDWDTDVPAINILKHKDNYLKIVGNYRKSFPNLGAPDERDLIEYVRSQYKQRGSNYQRGLAQAQFDENVRQYDLNRKDKLAESEWDKQKWLLEYNQKMSLASGGDGSTAAGTAVAGSFEEESQIANVNFVTNTLDGKSVTTDGFSRPDFWQKKIATLSKESSEMGYTPFKLKGYGGALQNSIVARGLSNSYSPKNGMKITSINGEAAAKAVLGADIVDRGMVRNLILKDQNWFSADGTKFSDNAAWFRSGVNKPRDFKVEGVVSVGVIKDGSGKDVIMMDRYGTFGGLDKEYGKKLVANTKNKNVKLSNVIALRDPSNNELVYVPFDTSSVPIQTAYSKNAPADVLTSQRKMSQNIYTKNEQIKETKRQSASSNKLFLEQVTNDPNAMHKVHKQAQINSVGAKNRTNLFMSFYVALTGMEGDPNQFANWVDSGQINKYIDQKVLDLMKQGASDQTIIQHIASKDPNSYNKTFYQNWINNSKFLSNK
jgi:hypothetical protein